MNCTTNALPPLLRAQTSAASLSAALEVLSRFVAMSLQQGPRSPLEAQITDLVGRAAQAPPAVPQRPAPSAPAPTASRVPRAPVVEEPPARYELEDEAETLELPETAPPAAVEQEFEGEFDV